MVNEKIANASDAEAQLPVAVFVGDEFGGVLRDMGWFKINREDQVDLHASNILN